MKSIFFLLTGIFFSFNLYANSRISVTFSCDNKINTTPTLLGINIDSVAFDLTQIKLHEVPLFYNEMRYQSGEILIRSEASQNQLVLGKVDLSLAQCAPSAKFSNPVPLIPADTLKLKTQTTLFRGCSQVSDHLLWTLNKYVVIFANTPFTYATFSSQETPVFNTIEECEQNEKTSL